MKPILNERDLSCVFNQPEVLGVRTTLRQVSSHVEEGHFFTLRMDRKIDFGTVLFHEDKFQCEVEGNLFFNFRVASKGIVPNYATPIIVMIPGLSGLWRSQVLLQATLLRSGFTIIYFDSRGSGENKNLERSFGYFEANDVIQIISYLRHTTPFNIGCRNIGIFGSCMGATAALRAATMLNGQKVVVVEGTYLDANSAISVLMPDQLSCIESLRKNYSLEESNVSPVQFYSEFPWVPLRMIWGKYDQLVPSEHRYKLIERYRNVASEFEYEFVDHASHMIQYGFPLSDDEVLAYMKRIAAYFSKHL